MRKKENELTNFNKKVEKIPFTDCWIWSGALGTNGYGTFYKDGKNIGAHRASYEFFVGKIPQNMQLMHSCDVRHCVNPSHLKPGTALENTIDKVFKKRHSFGKLVGTSKLTEDDVKFIRNSPLTAGKLSKIINCGITQICRIRRNECWKHI